MKDQFDRQLTRMCFLFGFVLLFGGFVVGTGIMYLLRGYLVPLIIVAYLTAIVGVLGIGSIAAATASSREPKRVVLGATIFGLVTFVLCWLTGWKMVEKETISLTLHIFLVAGFSAAGFLMGLLILGCRSVRIKIESKFAPGLAAAPSS